ncbi:helix-turn-helix domain-containing protein [Pararhizobium sp. DWP1-1-3]|uniref:helix-turn-helix domain-containing protein n=1 Tax=Pararhizobium sp. DWP1-1-3 TaxID=2804652 RepID=UPI003CF8F9A7
MIEKDGMYTIPVLPRHIAEQIRGVHKSKWPSGLKADYDHFHRQFTKAKHEYRTWIGKDRDSRMSKTAKVISNFMLDCLNGDTGRCDPSYQTIADELGVGVRTVERWVPQIAASGWMEITRRGKTTTNFYRWRVSKRKVHAILDHVDELREQRQERREARKHPIFPQNEPPEVASYMPLDPSVMTDHEPSRRAAHDPPEGADKSVKGTLEDEPGNKTSCSGGKEDSLYGQRTNINNPITANHAARNCPLAMTSSGANAEPSPPTEDGV